MRGLEFGRADPSNTSSIIHLLKKCERNLVGIVLRTEEPVKFAPADLKKALEVKNSIVEMLDSLDGMFVGQYETPQKERPKKSTVQHSAVQKYLRKYK